MGYWLFYIFAFPMFLIEKALRWLHMWAGKRIAKSALKDAHRGVFEDDKHNKVVFETRVESKDSKDLNDSDSADEIFIMETSGEMPSKKKSGKSKQKNSRKSSEGRKRSTDVQGLELELADRGETFDVEAGKGRGGKNRDVSVS